MSRGPHLLRVDAAPEAFAGLIAAAAEGGLRIGWLELESAAPLPATLESAAAAGAMRAVAAGGGRSVAVKPLRGEPVLRDLLREHFAGCAAVLVRGAIEAPRLGAVGGGGAMWRLERETAVEIATGELVARLRKPRLD